MMPLKAFLCGVLQSTNAQMENPIIAARWAARTVLIKEVHAKCNTLARKERKAKRQGCSLDRGASGWKKPKGGPSPMSYTNAVKGWDPVSLGSDGSQPSTLGSGQKSRETKQGASLCRSPRQDSGQWAKQEERCLTSRTQQDTSSALETAKSRQRCSHINRGPSSTGKLLRVGRRCTVMPPLANPRKLVAFPAVSPQARWGVP